MVAGGKILHHVMTRTMLRTECKVMETMGVVS